MVVSGWSRNFSGRFNSGSSDIFRPDRNWLPLAKLSVAASELRYGSTALLGNMWTMFQLPSCHVRRKTEISTWGRTLVTVFRVRSSISVVILLAEAIFTLMCAYHPFNQEVQNGVERAWFILHDPIMENIAQPLVRASRVLPRSHLSTVAVVLLTLAIVYIICLVCEAAIYRVRHFVLEGRFG
jgi:hypothetical protein